MEDAKYCSKALAKSRFSTAYIEDIHSQHRAMSSTGYAVPSFTRLSAVSICQGSKATGAAGLIHSQRGQFALQDADPDVRIPPKKRRDMSD